MHKRHEEHTWGSPFLDLSKQPLDTPLDIWMHPRVRPSRAWLGEPTEEIFSGLSFFLLRSSFWLYNRTFGRGDFGSGRSSGFLIFFQSCFDYFSSLAIIQIIFFCFFSCNWILSFSLDQCIIRFEFWILMFVFLWFVFSPKFSLVSCLSNSQINRLRKKALRNSLSSMEWSFYYGYLLI